MKKIVFLFCCIMLYSCELVPYKFAIRVLNNSEEKILVTLGMEDLGGEDSYRMTTEFPDVPSRTGIPPHKAWMAEWPVWDRDVKYSPQDSFAVFILHPDTVRMYDWQTIKKEKKYLWKYCKPFQEYEDFAWLHEGCHVIYPEESINE